MSGMRRTTARTRTRSSRLRRSSSPRRAIPADARVLDIGCGDGKVTALIRAASVTGCDRSPEMVALAAREHPECTFVVADVRELPFDAAFDVAVSFTALHWVVDGHTEAIASVLPRARAGRALPRRSPRRRQHGRADLGGRRRQRPACLARGVPRVRGSPVFMPSLDVYRPIVQASGLEIVRLELVPRDVVHESHRVSRAGSARHGWYTDRLPDDRRAAWIDEVVERYAERVPADERGASARPSFRVVPCTRETRGGV